MLHTSRRLFAAAVVVLTTVTAGGVAYVISQNLPPTYTARAQLLAGQALDTLAPEYEQLLAAPLVAQMYAQLATGRPLIDTVLQDLGLETDAEDLSERVRAETSGESALVTIEVSDRDPERASAIANQIAAELTSLGPDPDPDAVERIEAVERDLAAIGLEIERVESAAAELAAQPVSSPEDVQQLELLQQRAADLRLQRAALTLDLSAEATGPPIQVVSPSIPPDAPSGPRPLLNAALAGGVGFMLVTLLMFLPGWLSPPAREVFVTEPVVHAPAPAPATARASARAKQRARSTRAARAR